MEVGDVLLNSCWSFLPFGGPQLLILGELVVNEVAEEATNLEVIDASVIAANELFVGWEKLVEVGTELVVLFDHGLHLLISFWAWWHEEGADLLSEEIIPEVLAEGLPLISLQWVFRSKLVDGAKVVHDGGGLSQN